MRRRCNRHIRTTFELVKKLNLLADQGDLDSEDDGCRVLFGVVRDCAYKIRSQAEREREAHKQKGAWDNIGEQDAMNPGKKS